MSETISNAEPDRTVSRTELMRADGEGGRAKLVAISGKVYDVSDCPKWRGAMHENLHFPGQDLTFELPDAPHSNEVLQYPCVKLVGRLAE